MNKDGWIRVEDRLPDEATFSVLVVRCPEYADPYITLAVYENEGEYWADPEFEHFDLPVTHWQPLPELPDGLPRYTDEFVDEE